MISVLKKVFAIMEIIKSRIFSVVVLSLVVAFTVYKTTTMTQIIQVRQGNDVQTIYTMEQDPLDILAQNGIVTMAYDAVDFTGFEGKLGEINITRAFPIYIIDGGVHTKHMVTQGTVASFFEQNGITLNDQDSVDLAMEHPLQQDDSITITRQKFVTREQEEVLPYKTQTVPTSLLSPGKKVVQIKGETGLRVDTYVQMYVDAQPQEEYLKEQVTVKHPVDQQVLVGFASQPVSGLDFEYPFDENGEPIGYYTVLRGQKAAGYSAKSGAGTASGRASMVGHVAVNPNIIPYGSKLYIQSTDGKFVYGYSVAADTGTALMQGEIAVDLFYATHAQSAMNGIKNVDIFILK